MKFVKNNKILEDSNAENTEEAQRKQPIISTESLSAGSGIGAARDGSLFSLRFLCVLCVSALKSSPPEPHAT
jgi:hypothetical protein